MKRVLLTLVILMTGVLAKSQDLSNSIEYSQLYIVGPPPLPVGATPTLLKWTG